jgi:hypothetical protein
MGNRDNRTLFYICTGVAVLLLLVFGGTPQALLKKSKWAPLSTLTAEGEPEVMISAYEGRSRNELSGSKADDLGKGDIYQPTNNYVNSYTPKTEYQHPLIASTKFISKKDQKKKKKDKNKKAITRKMESKSKRQFGFTEDMDDSRLPTTRTTSQFVAQNKQNPTTKQEQTKKEEEENLNSMEYWAKPIFVDQDVLMVSKLIESYQIRKVSNNVFYDLVTEMRQDERLQIREFGLTALTSTPSVRSFAELSIMKHTDPDADLRTAASREVSAYYQEQRLSHVVAALKGTTADTNRSTYEALVVLNDATKKYSGVAPLEDGSPAPTTVSSNVELRFEQALTAIDQNQLTESKDSKIKAQAEKTSTALAEFVSR